MFFSYIANFPGILPPGCRKLATAQAAWDAEATGGLPLFAVLRGIHAPQPQWHRRSRSISVPVMVLILVIRRGNIRVGTIRNH